MLCVDKEGADSGDDEAAGDTATGQPVAASTSNATRDDGDEDEQQMDQT